MRLPLGVDIESRDGTLTKDAKVVNGFTEQAGTEAYVYKRPGNTDLGLIRAGTAQLLVFWNGLKAVIGDYFCTTGTATSVFSNAASGSWNTRTMPSNTTWQAIAYGGGRYCVVSQNGAVATSTDGITWVSSATITARTWHAMAWNGTVFCVIDRSTTNSATSPDGVTWTQTGVLPAGQFYGLASNGASFVATESSGGTQIVAISSNGLAWTSYATALPSAAQWSFLVWDGTIFCASDGASSTKAATSTDGITWTARARAISLQSSGIAASSACIIITHPTGAVDKSTDHGVTWTSQAIPITPITGAVPAAYSGVAFFIVDSLTSAGALSLDGTTWTATTLSNSGASSFAASNGVGIVVVNKSTATISQGVISSVVTVAAANLSPTAPGSIYSAQDNGSNAGTAYLMVKNLTQAWSLTNASGATPTLITDVDYPGTYAVTLTSLTRVGTVATATTASDTNFQVGSTVTIAGATPIAYNGAQVVTGVAASTIIPAITTRLILSISRSGATATATSTTGPHGLSNGQTVTISDATQSEYNGAKVITWISATQFSYTVTVTTVATGTTTPPTGSIMVTGRDVACSIQNNVSGIGNDKFIIGFVVVYNLYVTTAFTVGGSIVVNNLTTGVSGTYTITATASFEGGSSVSFTIPGFASTIPVQSGRARLPTVSATLSWDNSAYVTVTPVSNLYLGLLPAWFQFITIAGATPGIYNGEKAVTGTVGTSAFTFASTGFTISSADSPVTPATGSPKLSTNVPTIIGGASFTFTIAGSPATPATGTITATGGRATVPGICYLNGYFTVVDIYGVLYNSAPDDPTVWNALEYTAADSITGAAKAHAQTLNYLLVFKEWSIEPFYDRQDGGIGSPFAKLENGLLQVGCASGTSLAKLDGSIFWMSQTREEGRAIHVMNGTAVEKASTPAIDRVLKLDNLSSVYAWAMKINGHSFYILTLVNTNVTLVYDSTTKKWSQWTSVDDYFKYTYFANALGRYMTLHTSDGHLYEFSTNKYQDAGVTIATLFRTVRLDGGTSDLKSMSRATVIGDSVADTLSERHSDDDSSTWSAFRTANLAYDRPMYRRLGSFVRRTMEFKHTGNVPIRLKAIEIEVE